MSAFNELSYLNNNGLQHLNDRLHNTFRVTAGQTDYANLGNFATSIGNNTNANGDYSHAEGHYTQANGNYSHAEGATTRAKGSYSHAEGLMTNAKGSYSHAEGYSTDANGNYSHAEGYRATANGNYSHAEGYRATANGDYSHAEGAETFAYGGYSHAEGVGTKANGDFSHAEGSMTQALANYSHAGGIGTIANAEGATVFGKYSNDSQDILFGVGNGTGTAARSSCFEITNNGYIRQGNAELRFDVNDGVYGFYTNVNGDFNPFGGGSSIDPNTFRVIAGQNDYANLGNFATSSGDDTNANGEYSHAEGGFTSAIGGFSHAEGFGTNAYGSGSHAEGTHTQANGHYSHTEGNSTYANGNYSHAEGDRAQALSYASHAEGAYTKANGSWSHAEGCGTNAIGNYSHAEGNCVNAIGDYSHAEGSMTTAIKSYSHAGGIGTIANTEGATVFGTYSNDAKDILFGIGNGTDYANRSSCFEITTDGFIRTGDTKIRFGVDANGNYGYIKPGADTVYPFKSSSEPIKTIDYNFLGSNVTASFNYDFITGQNTEYIQAMSGNYNHNILKSGYYVGSWSAKIATTGQGADGYRTIVGYYKDGTRTELCNAYLNNNFPMKASFNLFLNEGDKIFAYRYSLTNYSRNFRGFFDLFYIG